MEAAQSSKQAQLALFQEEQKRIEEDICVPLRLKQGQVEMQPQGIVDSSMENAVLVALQLVQVDCGATAWGLEEGGGGGLQLIQVGCGARAWEERGGGGALGVVGLKGWGLD